MKTLFFFFTIFVLLLFELWLGALSIYMPLLWMGFFYFAVSRYPFRLLLSSGFCAAILLDVILFQRIFCPDILIFGAVFYMSYFYRDFWSSSIWSGGINGCLLILAAYFVQFLFAAARHGFSLEFTVDTASQMTALLPIGFLIQTFLIFMLDKICKKLHFDKSFVVQRQNDPISIYRRKREYDR